MTDRYNAFIVTLEHDLREDDAEVTIAAIKQIKGILDVRPHVAEIEDHIARMRVSNELRARLFAVLYEEHKGS